MQEQPPAFPANLTEQCTALYAQLPQNIKDAFANIQIKSTSIVSNIPLVNQMTSTSISNAIYYTRIPLVQTFGTTIPGALVTLGTTVWIWNKADKSNLPNKEEIKLVTNDTLKNIVTFIATISLLQIMMIYSAALGL